MGSLVLMYTSISVDAAAQIILRLIYTLPEEITNDADAYIVKTRAGVTETIKVSDLTVDSKGRYVVEAPATSQEFTTPVTVKFYNGEGTLLQQYDKDLMQNVDALTRSVNDYFGVGLVKGTDKQKELFKAFVTYGGYAQLQFGNDKENPAFNLLDKLNLAQLDLSGITAESIAEDRTYSENSIGVSFATQTAALNEAIALTTVFYLDEGEIGNYSFKAEYYDTLNKVNAVMDLEATYRDTRNGKARYQVVIPDICTPDWDNMYKVIATNKTTGETYEVNGSVMTYVKAMLSSSAASETQKNLGKAMYLVNTLASAFFGR